MASGIDEILAETDDHGLCSRLYGWIVERHGEFLDLSDVPEHERVVLSVWNVSGIIENGGFNFLFEGNLDGDPHYLLSADAFKVIGAQEAVTAFEQVFRLFPQGKPPADVDTRLNQYRRGSAARRLEIDRLFFQASKSIEQPLAVYVRAHREAYTNAAPVTKATEPAASTKPPPSATPNSDERDGPTLPDRIAALPHWARVALAARCARLALPEFRRAWPNARPKRLETVRSCIAAAERSALEGRSADNNGLTAGAMMVVGAAMMGLHGSPFPDDDEPYPVDGNLAVIASKAARVAHMAVEAAVNGVEKSANYAAEAVCDTIELAKAVENKTILRRLAAALGDLERESDRQGWDNDSAVSPTVFNRSSKPRRPWWKFW